MLQPARRRTWAPRGQTPVQKSWDRHDRLSVISAITIAPRQCRLGVYFRIQGHNIHADDVIAFVRQVHRHLRRNIILVLDRWSVHRAAVRRLEKVCCPWMQVEWLPAYAPELNPVEQIWSHTKYADLANYIPQDIEDLHSQVERSLTEKRYRPSLLRSFFKHGRLIL